MFITSYKPPVTNLKSTINRLAHQNNFRQHNSCDVYFSSAKQEIKGKEVGKVKIIKINPDNSRKDLELTVALNLTNEQGVQKIEYRFYTQEKKLLGRIRMDDTKVNKCVGYDYNYGKTPNSPEKPDHIYITHLESINDKSYKGIGEKLVQVAIEQSINKGHKGKVKLRTADLFTSELMELPSSFGCPTGFYYEKCHFRADPGGLTNENIEQELAGVRSEKKHPSEAKLNRILMHLPEEEISNFWLPKIKENPIILSKKELEDFEKENKSQSS